MIRLREANQPFFCLSLFSYKYNSSVNNKNFMEIWSNMMIGLGYLLEKFKISEELISKECKVSTPEVAQWLKGETEISENVLMHLADMFRLPEEFIKSKLEFKIFYNEIPIDEYLKYGAFRDVGCCRKCNMCEENLGRFAYEYRDGFCLRRKKLKHTDNNICE